MNSILEFNRNLNNSLEGNTQITNMKEQVDLLVRSTIKRLRKRQSVLVLGAGRMNDFSLRFLLDSFKKVTLTDIDIESTKKEINKQRIKKIDKERIELLELEYTGFGSTAFFEDFKELVLEARTFDDIDQILEKKIKRC